MGGNPFFVMRYLRYLSRTKPALLYFDDRRSKWQVRAATSTCSLSRALAARQISIDAVQHDEYRRENVDNMLMVRVWW